MPKIFKSSKDTYLVQIPNELIEKLGLENAEVQAVETSGFITLVPSKTVEKIVSKEEPKEDQMHILKKLCTIPLNKRDETAVKQVLDEKELGVLENLVRKGVIELANGTYTIKDRAVFDSAANYDLQKLGDEGYLILENEAEARDISQRIKRELEDRTLLAMRGFDNKYYLIVREFYEKISKKILDAIQGPTTLKDLTGKTSLREDLCRCIIEFLREDGLVLEKSDNTYVKVD
jgi:hypothetical protein